MYYIRTNKRVLGPFPADRLKKMIAEGKLKKEDSISPDKEKWKKAGEIEGLFEPVKAPKTPQSAAQEKRTIAVPSSSSETEETDKEEILGTQKANTLKLKQPPQAEGERQKSFDSTIEDETQASDYARPGTAVHQQLTAPEIKTYSLAVLWDPLGATYSIFRERGNGGAAKAGLILSLIALVCSFAILYDLFTSEIPVFPETMETVDAFLHYAAVAFVPILTLAVAGTIVRNIFAEHDEERGFGTDLLIAGSAYLPIALTSLLIYLIGRNAPLEEDPSKPLMMVVGGLVLYAVCCLILVLLSGITRIYKIKESIATFLIPAVILLNILLMTVTYRLLIDLMN